MTGFGIAGMSVKRDVIMRVLAKTSPHRVDKESRKRKVTRTVKLSERTEQQEVTRQVLSLRENPILNDACDSDAECDTLQVLTTTYTTDTLEYDTGCGGDEWREVNAKAQHPPYSTLKCMPSRPKNSNSLNNNVKPGVARHWARRQDPPRWQPGPSGKSIFFHISVVGRASAGKYMPPIEQNLKRK